MAKATEKGVHPDLAHVQCRTQLLMLRRTIEAVNEIDGSQHQMAPSL